MFTTRPLLALAACSGLLFCAATFAQDAPQAPPPPPQPTAQPSPTAMPGATPEATGMPSFDSLDKAHKGRLSRSDLPRDVEALKTVRAHFGEADKNGDGTLTPDEYSAAASKSK